MGLFRKKKTATSSTSVLTESEIQKKLYGDLVAQAPHVVIGEREHFKEPVIHPPIPQKTFSENEQEKDLFFAGKEPVIDSVPLQSPGQRSAEFAPRYVPLHDFESRTASPASVASGTDSSARFAYNRPAQNRMAWLADLLKNVLGPNHAILRQVVLWGGVVFVVFLLFWSVNALNSQREVAMHTRYSTPRELSAEPLKTSAPVAERPVVISPAPVRSKAASVTDAARTAVTPASPALSKGSYVIQVVTYPTREDADQVVASFKKAGIRAYVKENSRPSGRLFYLVLIRGGRTAEEAQAQLLKFKANEAARPFQDAFVKSSRS